MKRLLLGSAVAIMLAAGGVADVDARPSVSGKSSRKSPLGWNNPAAKKALTDCYDGDLKQCIDDAATAHAIAENFIAGLKNFKTKNIRYTSKVDTCVEDWGRIKAAAESIWRIRKTADIIPDCADAIPALNSTRRLVKEVQKAGEIESFPSIEGWPEGPPAKPNQLSKGTREYYGAVNELAEDIEKAKEHSTPKDAAHDELPAKVTAPSPRTAQHDAAITELKAKLAALKADKTTIKEGE
ncbi:hypothetical protein FACS189449_06370 [Alphaproteobacteria bacterium]|nr:hypothetical protein FACS189449_06370 [Alphaproteobacteria bacterium]